MKIRASLIYSLYSLFVGLAVMLTTTYIERSVGLHALWFTGDIDMLVAILVWDGIFFSLGNIALFRLEGIVIPSVATHFNQCIVLYVILAVFGIPSSQLLYKSVASGEYFNPGLTAIVYTIPFFVALAGIITNGLALYVRKMGSE